MDETRISRRASLASLGGLVAGAVGVAGWRSVEEAGAGPAAVEAGLVGDAARVLQMLLPRLEQHGDRAFLETIQASAAAWRELMVEQGTRADRPMKPQVVAYELDRLLADDAIIAADSGTNTGFAARTSSSTYAG